MLDLQNRELSRKTARNALLPSLSAYGFISGTGYAGTPNPLIPLQPGAPLVEPTGLGTSIQNALNYTSPEYQVGFQLGIPLRNRVNQRPDQYRTELEYRQSQGGGRRVEKAYSHKRCAVRAMRWSREPAAWPPRARLEIWPRQHWTSCRRSKSLAQDRTSRR